MFDDVWRVLLGEGLLATSLSFFERPAVRAQPQLPAPARRRVARRDFSRLAKVLSIINETTTFRLGCGLGNINWKSVVQIAS
jgi:hypothetical protein